MLLGGGVLRWDTGSDPYFTALTFSNSQVIVDKLKTDWAASYCPRYRHCSFLSVIAEKYFNFTSRQLMYLSASNTGSILKSLLGWHFGMTEYSVYCQSGRSCFCCYPSLFSCLSLRNHSAYSFQSLSSNLTVINFFFLTSVFSRYGHGFEMFCLASDNARTVVASACKVSAIRQQCTASSHTYDNHYTWIMQTYLAS